MNEKEKKQVFRLFGWILFGLGVIYIIQVIGLLSVEIKNNSADWLEWTLSLSAEVGIISSFLSPLLWGNKVISSKQHNYWTVINLGFWIVWIVASTVWVYLLN